MKYKYYFKKPKSEIVKDIFKTLIWGSAICIAATSPYFVISLKRAMKKWAWLKNNRPRYISSIFYRLKKQGLIKIVRKNHQIYISLTEKGKKRVGWMQIDALMIKKPKKWDKKWRLIMFDISEMKRCQREAFRGKLKELGFRLFQKSIWIYPYDCKDEIELLRSFFGLNKNELQYIITETINENLHWREVFKI